MKFMNTKKGGVARSMIFKYGKTYRAVCLDFDLVYDCESFKEAERIIKESVISYIKNVHKNNLDDSLLNRHADKKYWDMYDSYLRLITDQHKSYKPADTLLGKTTSLFTWPIAQTAACSC